MTSQWNLIFSIVFQVNVMFESNRLTILEDKPALGLESLLGTMGGTLNLWIGISFVTVIELIDMVLTLILGGISRPKVKDSPGDEQQHSQVMTDVGWWGRKWGDKKTAAGLHRFYIKENASPLHMAVYTQSKYIR